MRTSYTKHGQAASPRLCRRLAFTSVGTKKRQYDVQTPVAPSAHEWMAFLALPGSDGGLLAKEVASPFASQEASQPGTPCTDKALRQGVADFEMAIKEIRKARRRRYSPGWSVPAAVFMALTHPDFVSKSTAWRAGLGEPRCWARQGYGGSAT